MRRSFAAALMGGLMMLGALLMGALGWFAAAQMGGLQQVTPVQVKCPAPVVYNYYFYCPASCPPPMPGPTLTPTPLPGPTLTVSIPL